MFNFDNTTITILFFVILFLLIFISIEIAMLSVRISKRNKKVVDSGNRIPYARLLDLSRLMLLYIKRYSINEEGAYFEIGISDHERNILEGKKTEKRKIRWKK